MKHFNIPIFIPEMACPHRCVFCNQNSISGVEDAPKPSDISAIVDSYLLTLPDDGVIDIAFFGGSFTGIPIDIQEEYLKEAYIYLKRGDISGIRLSTRPDYINEEIIDLLKRYGVTTVELGAQSFDPEVLAASGRGHSTEDIFKASKLLVESGIELGLQMMIGLPGDTLAKAVATAKNIIECGASNTRIYPTLVIKETALAKLYQEGKYKALTIDQAVDWVKVIYPMFEEAGITVLRTGLHPSEEFEDDRALLDGPYHPSFKELVLSAIWRDRFETQLPKEKGKLVIRVASSEINFAIGYNSCNREWLKERYGWIKIKPDNTLKGYNFDASYC